MRLVTLPVHVGSDDISVVFCIPEGYNTLWPHCHEWYYVPRSIMRSIISNGPVCFTVRVVTIPSQCQAGWKHVVTCVEFKV